ncbi:MAG: hypothetical protein A2X86_17715 [Bdellovibrionales bacterium GWA2_49_15]|nr:MAG: hypothetical protein A2X86_17715 [Bdellovibrionales bacterium GWA2_49_15]
MSDLDLLAPSFSRAKNRWPDAPNLGALYTDLGNTYTANGSSLIEISKSFLETVCITILSEFGDVTLNEGTTYYLVNALDILGMKHSRGASTFDKILSGYNKLSDALNTIRNAEGRVSHGKDGYIDHISTSCGRAFLLTTDAILAFLLEAEAREGVPPELLFTREPHRKFQYYNKKIDSYTHIETEINEEGDLSVSFKVKNLPEFTLNLSASEILFYQDRQAYVQALEFLKHEDIPPPIDEIDIDDTEAEETVVPVIVETLPEEPPIPAATTPTGIYTTLFDKFNEEIGAALLAQGIAESKVVSFIHFMLDKIEHHIVVDWKTRDMALAAIKISIRHSIEHDLEIPADDTLVKNVLDWFILNITEDG